MCGDSKHSMASSNMGMKRNFGKKGKKKRKRGEEEKKSKEGVIRTDSVLQAQPTTRQNPPFRPSPKNSTIQPTNQHNATTQKPHPIPIHPTKTSLLPSQLFLIFLLNQKSPPLRVMVRRTFSRVLHLPITAIIVLRRSRGEGWR